MSQHARAPSDAVDAAAGLDAWARLVAEHLDGGEKRGGVLKVPGGFDRGAQQRDSAAGQACTARRVRGEASRGGAPPLAARQARRLTVMGTNTLTVRLGEHSIRVTFSILSVSAVTCTCRPCRPGSW